MHAKNREQPPDSEELAVTAEGIRFLYANLADISLLQFLFPLTVAWLFCSTGNHAVIAAWVVAVFAVYSVRIVLGRHFVNQPPEERECVTWGRYFTVTAVVSGLLWGTAAIIFYAPDIPNQMAILYVIIAGTAAGSLIATAYWLPGFFAYAFLSVGLIALNLFWRGSSTEKALAFLLLVFLAILYQVGKKSNQTALESIRLRFENRDLIKQLQREKDSAEAASNAKTRFLAVANHDLRQPVNALSLLTHSLKDELTTQRGRKLHASLHNSTENLRSLLESLLDLSRLDAGTVKPNKDVVILKPIVQQLLLEHLPTARKKDLRLSARGCDATVFSDHILLERLLRNLLSNAMQHTQTGGVLIGCRQRGQNLSIEVWDSGEGISQTEAKKIFSEFYQVEDAHRDHAMGLGLGLSICRRIADLLEHPLSFDSKPGSGSVFRVLAPLAKRFDADTIVDDQAPTDTDLSATRILIIEDHADSRLALEQIVQSLHAATCSAIGIQSALSLLEKPNCKPDLLLCDHRLGKGETGIQAIERIREKLDDADLPAIIITGDTSPDKLQALRTAAFPVLHKPVNARQLLMTIRSQLKEIGGK